MAPITWRYLEDTGATMSTDKETAVFQVLHEGRLSLVPLLYQYTTITTEYEERVVAIAKGIIKATEADTDASLASLLLDNTVNYGACQAFNTAILCAVLAPKQDCTADEVEAIVCSALTMNLSIITLLDAMGNGNTNITPLQKMSLESHNKLSHKMLSERKIKNREWLNAVMQHHERADGTGLLRMRGDTITKLAQLLGLVDRYCSVIATRASRNPDAAKALAKYTVRNDQEEQDATAQIEAIIGPYLPGSFVKLASGEIAVITHRTDSLAHPKVAVLGKQGALSIDSAEQRESGDEKNAIAEILEIKLSYNKIKLCKLWGYAEPTAPTAQAS